MTLTARELRARYPEVKWDEPAKITVTGLGTAYVCRYCIAQKGFRGSELHTHGGTFEDIEKHIGEEHR